ELLASFCLCFLKTNPSARTGFMERLPSGHNWVVVAILNSPRPWGASAILDQVLLSLHARK
ncbi:hypothetical protein, partial [Pseudomonas aeruginosa]|uniref:hypothetical protein n=1 Tax=Pseudomonas aeruginosa TaxID=287 RepID=UPI0019690989